MTTTHPTLTSPTLNLRTIRAEDFTALHALIQSSPETYRFSNIGADVAHFTLWFDQALREAAFVLEDATSGALLGSSRLYNINPLVPHGFIGYTWYAAEVMGTHINPTAKWLMLRYAFETLGYERVGFEVDAQNLRSRAAVEKLGATLEGVLRDHRRRWSDGQLSDTCSYAILKDEWPAVQARLLARLAAFGVNVS